MRKLLILSLALISQAFASIAVADKSAGEHVDDTTVTARVKFALAEQSVGDATDVNIETSKGVVQIAGWVDSEEIKARTERVASQVDGVKAISNRMLIKGGKRSAGRILDDNLLEAKIKFELSENESTNAMSINVEVRDGIVDLSGFVDSYGERNAAVDLAEKMDGVEKVINSMDITPN